MRHNKLHLNRERETAPRVMCDCCGEHISKVITKHQHHGTLHHWCEWCWEEVQNGDAPPHIYNFNHVVVYDKT